MGSWDEQDRDDFVVADMSDVRGSMLDSLRSLRPQERREGAATGAPQNSGPTHDIREELGGREERLMLVLGTLKAALSLASVYIVAFGVLIALMLALWT